MCFAAIHVHRSLSSYQAINKPHQPGATAPNVGSCKKFLADGNAKCFEQAARVVECTMPNGGERAGPSWARPDKLHPRGRVDLDAGFVLSEIAPGLLGP